MCLACCLTHTAGQASIETPPSTREGKQLYYIPQSSEIFQQNPWGFGGFPGPISLHSYGEPNVFPGSMGSGIIKSRSMNVLYTLYNNLIDDSIILVIKRAIGEQQTIFWFALQPGDHYDVPTTPVLPISSGMRSSSCMYCMSSCSTSRYYKYAISFILHF